MTKPNPIYMNARESYLLNETPVHISLPDTAKCIRAVLKAKYPETKFSVRSSRYSGGSSITAYWHDGPLSIDEILKPYQSAGFDGMIDMEYSCDSWLYPDGSAGFRATEGTTGSRGTVSAESAGAVNDDAIPVRFGVKYCFGQRRLTRAQVQRDLIAYATEHNDALAQAIAAGSVTVAGDDGYAYAEGTQQIRIHDCWGDQILHRWRHDKWRQAKEAEYAAARQKVA